jgi:hypothetical protein
MSEENKSLDLLGVKPIADSVNTVTKGTVDGASAFLSRICLPAAEEFGLLLKDKVSSWRATNAVNITNKAQSILEEQAQEAVVSAHPRIVYSTIENGSWAEDDFMQSLWAGLLASSCTPDGKDESNIILIGMLSQLTSSQAKVIAHICETATIYQSENGFITCDKLVMKVDDVIEITGITDIHQLDRELDHLRSLELIDGGFSIDQNNVAQLTPHSLCLQLYARAKGFVGSPIEFYDAEKRGPNKAFKRN